MDYNNTLKLREALSYDFKRENSLHGLSLFKEVKLNSSDNSSDDVEVVSWLLFFYFGSTSDYEHTHGLKIKETNNALDILVKNPKVFTETHALLVRWFQKLHHLDETGTIKPLSPEHILLVKNIIPFLLTLTDYECHAGTNMTSEINPNTGSFVHVLNQAKNVVLENSMTTAAFIMLLFLKSSALGLVLTSVIDSEQIGNMSLEQAKKTGKVGKGFSPLLKEGAYIGARAADKFVTGGVGKNILDETKKLENLENTKEWLN